MSADGNSESGPGQDESDDRSAFAKALDVAYQLIGMAFVVGLPAIGGLFLDRVLGTVLLFAVIGLLLGLAAAVYQFVRLIQKLERQSATDDDQPRSPSNKP
jgi:F0F1-type ATP synthase assembly protein I